MIHPLPLLVQGGQGCYDPSPELSYLSREAREAAREKQRERLRGGEAVEQPEEDTSRRKHKVGVERGC